jgi:hypothetical protein
MLPSLVAESNNGFPAILKGPLGSPGLIASDCERTRTRVDSLLSRLKKTRWELQKQAKIRLRYGRAYLRLQICILLYFHYILLVLLECAVREYCPRAIFELLVNDA